ncbi:MAG TPA: FAD-binding oxidoreductase, partial [Ilumatobacteraceae bacterium]
IRLLQSTAFDWIQPAAVISVASADDVAKTIAFARATNQPFTIRSGGHSYCGWSTGEGLVIDTRALAGLGSAEADGTYAVGAGTQLVDLYEGLDALGLAVAGGSCPTVGLGGLALGGGHGLTSRNYGLTCDAVAAVEIITADGTVRRCDAVNEPDLFWAVRGGGGSFGVVTRFFIAPHPTPPSAVTFTFKYSWQTAHAALAAWMAWLPSQPNTMMSTARFENSTSLLLDVNGLFLGSLADAKSLLAPLLSHPTTSQNITARRFVDALLLEAGCLHTDQTACHTATNPGGTLDRSSPFVATSLFFDAALPDAAIESARQQVAQRVAGAQVAAIQFDSYGGAIASIAPDATAFVHRNAFVVAQCSSYYNTGDGTADRAWVRATHDALAPFSNGESYQNYVDAGLPNFAQAYYGANLPRLQQLKAQYDPANVFSFPQSVPLP